MFYSCLQDYTIKREENKVEKAKRDQQKELEKEYAVKLMADNEKRADIEEKKRLAAWNAREEKIQKAMGRMADTVLKKSNAAEKAMEQRVIQYAKEKDKKEEQREKDKKNKMRLREEERKKTLDQQIKEKNQQKAQQVEQNKKYIQMVLD